MSTKRSLGNAISTPAGLLVLICSSLLLGVFYSNWISDYSTIWSDVTSTAADHQRSIKYYKMLSSAPQWHALTIKSLFLISLFSAGIKVILNGRVGLLFDGATLLLLISAGTVYMTTVQSSLDFINESSSGDLEILKHLASSHMLISVAVTGVLSLQAGQLYSEKAR